MSGEHGQAGGVDWGGTLARYRAMGVRFVAGLLGEQRGLAEDLFQEAARATYERGTRGGKSFESAAHVRNYLFRVLTNLAVDARRSRARDRCDELPPEGPPDPTAPDAAEGEPGERRRMNEVVRALGELGQRERRLLRLRYLEGLTFREISEKDGTSISTLQARVEAALLQLRRKVGKGGGPP